MISVVLNTACMGQKAKTVQSSGGVVHGMRVDLLREIIQRCVDDPRVAETIVVGEFVAGEDYDYIPCPSQQFNCTDALLQRHQGARVARGNLLLFLHDDHVPGPYFFDRLAQHIDEPWDVLVPARRCYQGRKIVTLNNGKDGGYVMGHASVMRRHAVDVVPWNTVAKVFAWDVDQTTKLREAGMTIQWADDLDVFDLEVRLGAQPWQ